MRIKDKGMPRYAVKIWQCRCGQHNSAGLLHCARCGQSRAAQSTEVFNAGDCRSRCRHAEPECAEQAALVSQVQAAEILGKSAPRLRVIIERHAPRTLDYDNFVGGCKQLRDAIAELLGRKGDAEEDGLEFGYVQKKGQKKMVIRIEAENG